MSKTLVQNVQTISNCLKLEQENNPEELYLITIII